MWEQLSVGVPVKIWFMLGILREEKVEDAQEKHSLGSERMPSACLSWSPGSCMKS